jgi:hypothetical protein
MNPLNMKRVAAAALIGLAAAGTAPQAWAGMQDYEFQLVRNEIKQGDTTVAVRLINKKNG